MDPHLAHEWLLTRRHFLSRTSTGLGVAALATLLGDDLTAQISGAAPTLPSATGGLPGLPHFAPKAKRVIYLFQSGAPSQHELFDYKPRLAELRGSELPDSVRGTQRLTAMTAAQQSFPVIPSLFQFAQHGESRAWVSELMPYTAKVADDLCFVKSMYTEAINHDPGITFFQTGAQLAGRPSIGAWLSYGLGSLNRDLPTFVALVSFGTGNGDQPLYDRLCADLDKAGVPMVGPALAWYDDAPGGGVLVHAGMPVEAEPGTYDGYTVTDLPAVELAATIVHRGPMDDVMPTIQTLARWIEANGYRSAGYNRELYLSYGEGPGPWEVELQEPVRTG